MFLGPHNRFGCIQKWSTLKQKTPENRAVFQSGPEELSDGEASALHAQACSEKPATRKSGLFFIFFTIALYRPKICDREKTDTKEKTRLIR